MQDEIAKHTKKIYDTMKDSKHSFGEKVKDIFIEIFIIVFAVTLSIWLHSWSEHREQQNEVRELMTGLKENLSNDISNMQTAKDTLSKNADNFLFIQLLTNDKMDSLFKTKASFGFNSSIGTTKFNNGDYEGFKSSGKIGFIENKDLKRHILKYYQEAMPNVLEAEQINGSQVLKISDYWNENAEQDVKKTFLSPKFKAILKTYQSTTKGTLDSYQEAITLAKQIINEIDKQNN